MNLAVAVLERQRRADGLQHHTGGLGRLPNRHVERTNGLNGIKTFPEEERMTKRFFGVLAVAALTVAVAAPLSAQSIRLTATIPFDFIVGNKTMPSGDYNVMTASSTQILVIRNVEMKTATLALTQLASDESSSRPGTPMLVFNRYGDQYVLAQVWGSPGAGREFGKSRTERELSKTASVKKLEIVAMLMPR